MHSPGLVLFCTPQCCFARPSAVLHAPVLCCSPIDQLFRLHPLVSLQFFSKILHHGTMFSLDSVESSQSCVICREFVETNVLGDSFAVLSPLASHYRAAFCTVDKMTFRPFKRKLGLHVY